MKNRREEIMTLWEKGKGVTEISRELHLSTGYVSIAVRKELGDNYIKRTIYKRRVHEFDDSFFEIINTEAKAYFLGLLAADGNIAKHENLIRIGLHEKDKEILEIFRKSINFSGELRYVKKSKEDWNRSNQYLLVLFSPTMKKDLERQEISPNKSLTLTFPSNISKNLLNHYLRGYFDGDGCISVGKTNIAEVSIAGSVWYCEALAFLFLEYDISAKVYKHYKANCYYARIKGKDNIMRFYNFLYNNSTIYLSRKKDIFDNWIRRKEIKNAKAMVLQNVL